MESVKELKKGEYLFKKGERGGGLFVVTKGSVQVYQSQHGVDNPVKTIKENGLLGLLTCFKKDYRTTSAVALEDSIVKVLPRDDLLALVEDVPDWMKIILKEFTLKLNSTLELSLKNSVDLNKIQKKLIDYAYISTIVSGLMSFLFNSKTKKTLGAEYVDYHLIVGTLKEVIDLKSEEVEAILRILLDEGLLELKTDPATHAPMVSLASMQGLPEFQRFVKLSKSSTNKKLVETNFSPTESLALAYILKYCAEKELVERTNFTLEDLQTHFGKNYKKQIGPEAFEIFINLELLSDRLKNGQTIYSVFPKEFKKKTSMIFAFQKLKKLKFVHPSKKKKQVKKTA